MYVIRYHCGNALHGGCPLQNTACKEAISSAKHTSSSRWVWAGTKNQHTKHHGNLRGHPQRPPPKKLKSGPSSRPYYGKAMVSVTGPCATYKHHVESGHLILRFKAHPKKKRTFIHSKASDSMFFMFFFSKEKHHLYRNHRPRVELKYLGTNPNQPKIFCFIAQFQARVNSFFVEAEAHR